MALYQREAVTVGAGSRLLGVIIVVLIGMEAFAILRAIVGTPSGAVDTSDWPTLLRTNTVLDFAVGGAGLLFAFFWTVQLRNVAAMSHGRFAVALVLWVCGLAAIAGTLWRGWVVGLILPLAVGVAAGICGLVLWRIRLRRRRRA